MWSLPRKDGDFARLVLFFSLDAASGCGSLVVGFSWEPGSDGGREEGAEGGVADEEEEEEEEGKGAPPAALAEAARASPLRISVVSGEVDRARIQGAA